MPTAPSNPTAPARPGRRTPMAARGEPMIWLMGLALLLCTLAVVALVGKVLAEGARTFWPAHVQRITLRGEGDPASRSFFAIETRRESFDPPPDLKARLDALAAAGSLPKDAVDDHGRPIRIQFRAGNRDLGGQSFLWVPAVDIAAAEESPTTLVLERLQWGIFLGTPAAAFRQVEAAEGSPPPTAAPGGPRVERVKLADGPEATRAALPGLIAEAHARAKVIRAINTDEIGAINRAMVAAATELRQADRLLANAKRGARTPSTTLWAAFAAAAALSLAARALLLRGGTLTRPIPTPRRLAAHAALVVGLLGLLGAFVERPWRDVVISPERHAAIAADVAQRTKDLAARYDEADRRKKALEKQDAEWRLLIHDATGQKFAPTASTDPDQPMLLSQVVRAVDANTLSTPGKLTVYADRWAEFLTDDPREQNTEGGVFPVIFGTVLLTILLSVVVVPFGVIAALYLREYARQGLATSMLRIAINNLAGVPSIVFGMFGLGFFKLALGSYIDTGPEHPASHGAWWAWAAAAAVVVLGALAAALFAKPTPGQPATRRHRLLGTLTLTLWIAAGAAAVLLAAHTPYFDGFFAARPDSTFGKPGLLWAAMTLALLTLPVVIVSTEEAVAAVPRSMREGSYGCGASKWQTILRIVLPGAMPGIMTGMILAMARGAGEVAPLMLVGAMKLAPELPFSTSFPFLHAQRSFMHLGFHIYDLGFQSPDAEAARPLVWTTTLLLIAIVVTLNLAAILLRARLKARSSGSAI